ncbi:ATP-grasp domain-containing protein [Paenibacillus harenae]|uniref:ATP-grasp domain-containing protein n=1 Tax=Paenibacillus harenae TaxID=306543 RepID=UPI0027930370|nr:ATP-grasp domain-containing protein [Paenibacillus harenae]MDQ0061705.1 hypothetical protein [Paenibacillus harenae]
MEPLLTLEQIFGRGYVMNGRGSYHNSQWLPNEVSQDSSSGSLLTLAGDIPMLCHTDVRGESCLALLQAAGLRTGSNLLTYEDADSYYDWLKGLQQDGKSVIFNYAHLPDEFEPGQYWIKRELHLFLNNKRNLAELVPNRHVPSRVLLSIDEFMNNDRLPYDYPCVVKAATDQPSGGGIEVVICRSEADLEQAKTLFRSCSFVVAEQFLAIKKNFCIQFAQTHAGELVYLGSAEQIITEQGKYAGNWFDEHDQPPAEAVELCKQVMRKAVSLGYLGFAGIDTVITEDNQIYIIDLNFRQNGSTAALLYRNSVVSEWGATVMKARKWKSDRAFGECKRAVESFISEKRLLPLCIFNPTVQTAERPIFVSCVLVGNSKDEVMEAERQMQALGFE